MEDKREKNRLRSAEWRKNNPEKAKETVRKHNEKRKAEKPEIIRAYQQAYREKNRETLRHRERERKFGISRQEYANIFLKQNGVCAICKQPETATRLGTVKSLSVDHCHTSGKVRGLLCSDCNTGIGKMKESREALLAAIRYLDEHSEDDANVVKFCSMEVTQMKRSI
jgi:hypothetical protein